MLSENSYKKHNAREKENLRCRKQTYGFTKVGELRGGINWIYVYTLLYIK